MLSVSGYKVAYGQSTVIEDMNFEVGENEIVAVLGRNGMGKTTLMNSLMGIVPTAGGTVSLDGVEVTNMKSYQRVSNGFGFVPQGRMIFSTMTVKENIETGLTTVKDKTIPPDLYELFPVLDEMKSRRGGNLSGGQQQQLAIARALASNPKMLLLDEPTEGIQPSIIQEMARTLRRIRDQRGLSIVVSEQVLSFALNVADRVVVLEKGKIVHDAKREDVDETEVASYLSV